MGGSHIRLEGFKETNINGSATIEHGFPVLKFLLIKLNILTKGPGLTSSFVSLTVIRSEIFTGLSD